MARPSMAVPRGALPVLLLAIVALHAVIAVVYVPVHSDMDTYRRYAASVASAIERGGSVAAARDRIIVEAAQRPGKHTPTANELLVEYPPLAVGWMAATGIGLAFDVRSETLDDAYTTRFRISMLFVDLLILLVLLRWATPTFVSPANRVPSQAWRLAIFGATTVILGNLLFDRLDLIVGGLLLAGVVTLARGHWLATFVILAIAINFKASPIALAPLWVIASLPPSLVEQARSRPGPLIRAFVGRSAILVGTTAAIFMPFAAVEGTRAVDFVRFRAIQGIHVESIPGAILLALHELGLPLEVTASMGTFEVQTPMSAALATISPVLLLVAALVVAAIYTITSMRDRRPRPEIEDQAAPASCLAAADPSLILMATVATLLLTLVTSKLLSPQYLLWIAPMVPLLEVRGLCARAFQLWFVATCALTTAIFPYLLGRTLARLDPTGTGYLDPTLLGTVLLVARNGLLVWLSWLAVDALWRHRQVHDDTDLGETSIPPSVNPQTGGAAPG